MTEADAPAFISALTAMCELFDRKPSKELIEIYWLALKDRMTPGQFKAGCGTAAVTLKFMPKPAELLEVAGLGGAKTVAYRTAEAWEAVRAAMDRYDYTTSVDFGPLVNAVVRNLGGWVSLCDKSTPDLVWVRKDFERLYEAFAEKPPDALHGDPLRGQFGGEPVLVAIGGVKPQRRLEESVGPSRDAIRGVIRDLGDEKS